MVDGSVRDYQKFSVTSGKNWPGTGPLGPWIVTSDEIPDPGKLTLTTRLNGLRAGGKGSMQDVQYSLPMEVLLEHPTILELESVGDDDDKALSLQIRSLSSWLLM